MATETEKRMAELKEQIEQGRQLRYKYEARLEELKRQRERLLGELAELGVEPERLSEEIERLRAEVEALLSEAEALLPSELVRR